MRPKEETAVSVVFRLSTGSAAEGVAVEVEGPEPFVRGHVEFLVPFLRRTTGAGPAPGAGPGAGGDRAGAPSGIEGVAAWWERSVPAGVQPTLQETILIFAWYMRSYRKTVFVSEDIRRCFQILGIDEPRSLLQILGSLKRDQGLLLNAGKRGEYMMNTTGLARAREMLGERRPASPGPGEPSPGPKAPDARTIFQD